jgi:hypothetical protein
MTRAAIAPRFVASRRFPLRLPVTLSTLGALAACGLAGDELATGEVTSAATVSSFITTSCTTAVVIGLSRQIADEVGCASPSSLVTFAAGSGITITSNAVLPYLAANARAALMAVGNVQVNSAFRTVAQQYLLLEWFNRGRCGITAAAPVGRSNHESGRAVDLANWSARVTAMANRGWSHSVPGDPVHFDHLGSADIRGKDTLAFQRLWNRNHPTDRIGEDGAYGPQTEARLRQAPATGFPIGPSCARLAQAAELVAVDGPDRVAPGARVHYRLTVHNTTDTDWPATTRITTADGAASELYDAASWVSNVELGELGVAIAAGAHAVVEVDLVAPRVATATPVATQLALRDGSTQVGAIDLAMTVTPDGDEARSADADDHYDGEVTGGCAARGGAGWLAVAPLALLVRRRRAR